MTNRGRFLESYAARQAIFDLSLPLLEKAILLVLAHHMDRFGISRPGTQTIAEDLSVTTRAIEKALVSLRGAGYIEPMTPVKGGRSRTTEYRIPLLNTERRSGNRSVNTEAETGNDVRGIVDNSSGNVDNSVDNSTNTERNPERNPERDTEPRSGFIVDFPRQGTENPEKSSEELRNYKNYNNKKNDPPISPSVRELTGDAWQANRLESFRRKYPRPFSPGTKGETGSTVREIWREACTDDDAYNAIMAALDTWIESESWKKNDGQYIPGALKFLEERWYEKPPTMGQTKGSGFDPDKYRQWRNGG